MLTMTQQYNIKYLSFHKGKKYSEISRETDHDFKTVKKYAEKEDFNDSPPRRKKKSSKLDPFKPTIDQWLREDTTAPVNQRHTAKRIHDRLKEEFKEEFDVSERNVRYYVSAKKSEIFGGSKAYLPLEHPPGEAQVDFGESLIYENGKEIKGHSLVLSFPNSNVAYEQVFRGQNQECLLEGLQRIFNYISGVPTKVWFDNLSAAVKEIKKKGERELIEQFEKFALHYGFLHNFCNAGKSNEKGHVENKVGFTRRNHFVPVPSVSDIEDLNEELFQKAEKDAQKLHYKKQKKEIDLFEEDKNCLLKLPDKPFEIGRLVKKKTNKYGKIEFDKKSYSTSPRLVGKQVWLYLTHDRVDVLDEDYNQVVSHPRLYQETESMKWYPYLELIAKRPNALKYTGFYKELPDPWQDYLEYLDYPKKKKALHLLKDIIEHNDMDTAADVLSQTLKDGVDDVESIRLTWTRKTSNITLPSELVSNNNIPSMTGYTPNFAVYDELLDKVGDRK